MQPRRIVVTGGSGFVGRALCGRLAATWPGCRVLVPTRHLRNARSVQCLPNVDVLACDVHHPAQLAAALPGADVLVHLVAVLHGDAARFDRVHVALPRTLAAAARAAGIPARYVTGYLVTGQGASSTAAHAWAEALVPDLGWVGFDPANAKCPTDNYVRVAAGLDAAGVAPVGGSRRGGDAERMRVEVRVEIAQQ